MSTPSLEQAQRAVMEAFGNESPETVMSLNAIAGAAALTTSYAATALCELERRQLVQFSGGGWALTRRGRARATAA
jgi:DNA-binding IscR family transcriptional regulator